MKSIRYPGCCVASVLTGFGQTATADIRYRPEDASVKSITLGLKREMKDCKDMGEAILTVIVNDQQVNAIEALTELGWYATPWTKKQNHSETMVSLWTYLVDPQPFEVEV